MVIERECGLRGLQGECVWWVDAPLPQGHKALVDSEKPKKPKTRANSREPSRFSCEVFFFGVFVFFSLCFTAFLEM